MASPDIEKIQATLQEWDLDGWLLYDFHHSNPIAYQILGFDQGMITRRWFYWIPKEGAPIKLVHSIEADYFDETPGRNCVYTGWQDMNAHLEGILTKVDTVAMEYSPKGAIPYISRVDTGTFELVKSFGIEIVSSADLVQLFQSRWDDEAYQLHNETVPIMFDLKDGAFQLISEKIEAGETVTECDVQEWITDGFRENGMETEDPPIVAVNEHSGQPHYSPSREHDTEITEGDFVLIDMWARKSQQKATYVDITWTGFVGDSIPNRYTHIFDIVAEARDAAVQLIQNRWESGKEISGWEVDNAARAVIEDAGYGKFFTHRTGHSLDTSVHGNGVNIDNLETQDRRKIIPGMGFTIEPGIYLSEFGIRSEIDVYMSEDGPVVTTTPLQKEVLPLLA
ncbi:MAG: Xaa-Pro peptidase family protein [Candidatus Marinimicrobia bacterium]|nr:Xaa-Pro peptidase family protein [Candidatus Neomarinimicrobiota bacterium]MCF7827934.1 Xaa-Pro peptidase family protein [Candidatus Neomarinimicrobiota bacterium]MCF7879311.1 Xaa-Pro peptidase family protein [Candidatus Neomarinimicrobiota bacterium]